MRGRISPILITFSFILFMTGCLSYLAYKGVFGTLPFVGGYLANDQTVVEVKEQTPPKPNIFEKAMAPIYEEPTRLFIETKKIDIKLVPVSLEETGQLQTPPTWTEGGWYIKSARPGENGNVIINAHYDNNFGAPAAFWELKNILENDNVYLVDKLGKRHTYQVRELFYVDIQDPNRLKVFEDDNSKSELTLITCGGVWNYGLGYSKRLVVKAELVKNTTAAFVSTK